MQRQLFTDPAAPGAGHRAFLSHLLEIFMPQGEKQQQILLQASVKEPLSTPPHSPSTIVSPYTIVLKG